MALSFYKWLLVPFILFQFDIPVWVSGHSNNLHPYFVSVTEINKNASEKSLEISCKLFTDDFEKELAKTYNTKVDLVHPADSKVMDKLVNDYLQKHLAIKLDGKPVILNYIGFEQEAEAVYGYFQVNQVNTVKKIEVTNTVLHGLNESQVNIVHVTVNGNRKSTKLDYPKSTAVFQF